MDFRVSPFVPVVVNAELPRVWTSTRKPCREEGETSNRIVTIEIEP